jgi:hypothetical protein
MDRWESLRVIGYWKSKEEPFWPDPAWFVDPDWAVEERNAVLRYLRSPEDAVASAGYSWCRFRCGERTTGCMEYTDGFWRWPEGLAHYVEKHNVRLPDEFVASALSKSTPDGIDKDWWKGQRGWASGSSFDTPGWRGKLVLRSGPAQMGAEAFRVVRKAMGTVKSVSIQDLQRAIGEGRSMDINDEVDYCDVAEFIEEGRRLGVRLEFVEIQDA